LVFDSVSPEDFGFENILWVFSGRRGVHCWICDDRIMKFDNEQRSKLVDYFHLYEGNENSRVGVKIDNPVHPSINRAYQILIPFFIELMENQEMLLEENLPAMFACIDNQELKEQLMQKVILSQNRVDGREAWGLIQQTTNTYIAKSKKKIYKPYLIQLVLSHMYPRLDVNVSKQINHLLKAPFCVHPKTSNVFLVKIAFLICSLLQIVFVYPLTLPVVKTLTSLKFQYSIFDRSHFSNFLCFSF
jgi:DNA primase small subunit